MTVAGQEAVNYSYDSNSRLTQILTDLSVIASGAKQSLSFAFNYDELGRRISTILPNGVTTNYSYDNASHLLELKHLNPLNQILESLNYVYDANGNRTKMDRQNVSVKLPNAVTNTTYNQANQMLTFNDKSITYDANGNMTSVTNACGITNYTWDVRNRLAGISGFNTDCAPLTASFKYDALGRRIEKTINSKTINYLYDGLDIVQEIENGTVTVNYVRTLNIDEPLARIKTDGTIRFYQQDALGSVIALTDETGVIKTQYSYDPFGAVIITGEASDNPFQFAGRENDGTGLLFERNRYLSFELQRYISQDPIGFAGGDVNFYSRVGNNPVNFVDPLGLFSINVGLEGFVGAFGFGGTGGIYGAYVHDPSQPWYKGWSAYTVVTYGGGGAGTVRGAGGGLYIGGSNASNICDLKGLSGYGGRVGSKLITLSGYANSGGLKGGGITIGPSYGYTAGFGGATNTKILWGGSF